VYHPEKSGVAEHSINLGHCIQLQDTSILAKKLRCMDRIIREAIEIKLHPNNMNREDGFSLSRSWKPLINNLREWKQALTKNMTPPAALKRSDSFTPPPLPAWRLLIGLDVSPSFLISDWSTPSVFPFSDPI
jgi:hypothetical protein